MTGSEAGQQRADSQRIVMSIPLGINVRDIVRLGTLDAILAACPRATIWLLTPAHRVPEFRAEVEARPRVRVLPFTRFQPGARVSRAVGLRRRARIPAMRSTALALETRLADPRSDIAAVLREARPHLVVTIHPQDWWDWEMITFARRLGVPTLGVVKSWDNIQRGLMVHPDFLAVWNNVNRDEALQLEGYPPSRVRVVGAPPFDRYFDPSIIRPRDEFMHGLGLDPSRPMALYAPAGQIMDYGDETFMLEELLRIRERSQRLRSLQIVARLHANSKLEYFWPYRTLPGVALSFGSYIKTLGWSMTRDEVDHMANLIHHADVVISPGSTVVLEAALFDRPSVVPAFHDAQPEHIQRWLIGWHFAKHYRPLVENDWVPVAWSTEELETMIGRALDDASWYRARRGALVEHYIPLRDGKTASRVGQLVADLLEHGEKVRNSGRRPDAHRIDLPTP